MLNQFYQKHEEKVKEIVLDNRHFSLREIVRDLDNFYEFVNSILVHWENWSVNLNTWRVKQTIFEVKL